jgi:hypothetical protein
MRRKLILTLGLSALLVMGVAAVAFAKFDRFIAGNLVLEADGGVTPKALPKSKPAPVTVHVQGKISTTDGTHPSAFREATIDFDKNGSINTTGLPACTSGKLQAQDTKHAKAICGSSIVGSGSGKIEIAFPESRPIDINAPITVFNGGTKGGTTTLFIHTFITVPVPSAVVTTVTIKKIHAGRYGLGTVSKIPVIAGGSGSVLAFDISFGKSYTYKGKKTSYLMAKCPDGHFNAKVLSAIFKNEAKIPGVVPQTVLKGTVIRPCTTKG